MRRRWFRGVGARWSWSIDRRLPRIRGKIRRSLLLCSQNFRAAEARRHFGGRSLLERALPHCDLGDRFVDRRIPVFPVGAWRRRSCGRAKVAIGPAQAGVFVAERILFRWPRFVVRAARPLPTGVTTLAMLFAITESHALRWQIFRIAGARPRAGITSWHGLVWFSGESLAPLIRRLSAARMTTGFRPACPQCILVASLGFWPIVWLESVPAGRGIALAQVTTFTRGGFEGLFRLERSAAARCAVPLMIEIRTFAVRSLAIITARRFDEMLVRLFAGKALPRILRLPFRR